MDTVCILYLFSSPYFHFSYTQLFLSCLEAIQSQKILIDIDQRKLYSNIREICEVNIKFWTLYLYPMVGDVIIHLQCCEFLFLTT